MSEGGGGGGGKNLDLLNCLSHHILQRGERVRTNILSGPQP